MQKLTQAQLLSQGHRKLKLTLIGGAVIWGYSLGRVPARTEAEEAIDLDVVAPTDAFLRLREADIQKVEPAC